MCKVQRKKKIFCCDDNAVCVEEAGDARFVYLALYIVHNMRGREVAGDAGIVYCALCSLYCTFYCDV